MVIEFRLNVVNLKLDTTKVMVQKARERAKATEAKVQEVEAEVALAGSSAIEEYKKSEDLKDKVGEATYDDFQKGFTKCEGKITEAFPDLDLRNIVAEEPESLEKEEEVEVEATEETLVVKTEEAKIEGAKEVGAAKDAEKAKEVEATEDPEKAEVGAIEDIRTKATIEVAKEGKTREAIGSIGEAAVVRTKGVSIQETIAKAMAEIKAAVKALKASLTQVTPRSDIYLLFFLLL